MRRYVLRRLLHFLPVLLGLTVFVFLIIHLIPGDPARIMLGIRATPENIERLRHALGLDRSLIVQYVTFLANLLKGNLGTSIAYRTGVLEVILQRLPATLMLICLGAVISIAFAVPLGVLSALRPRGLRDNMIRLGTLFGFTMPSFWVALLLMMFLGVRWGIFPVSGFGKTFGERLWHLVLPSFVLGLYLTPVILRPLRASILESLQANFVTTARAKGLKEWEVTFRHAFRNALIPSVTIFGVNIGWLLGGTVVIEATFSLPGIGMLLVGSIFKRDYPMVQGVTFVFGFLIITINFVTDVLYSYLDPRIRMGE
ncbi:MAG: ABC transporter permease [Deltaproteobacteria bacterium]|nr:ABC transporter permease [Deltaproteobacteria bacterium]MBW2122855.1 ABC transporter permease [Deltaproteobacteria bacterium]